MWPPLHLSLPIAPLRPIRSLIFFLILWNFVWNCFTLFVDFFSTSSSILNVPLCHLYSDVFCRVLCNYELHITFKKNKLLSRSSFVFFFSSTQLSLLFYRNIRCTIVRLEFSMNCTVFLQKNCKDNPPPTLLSPISTSPVLCVHTVHSKDIVQYRQFETLLFSITLFGFRI